MKIEVELPEWCAERHIYIMAGIELAAWKPYGENVIYVKAERCNQCGICCKNLPPKYPLPKKENMDCQFLEKQGETFICSIAGHRPWTCAFADPVMTNGLLKDQCCIRYLPGGKVK